MFREKAYCFSMDSTLCGISASAKRNPNLTRYSQDTAQDSQCVKCTYEYTKAVRTHYHRIHTVLLCDFALCRIRLPRSGKVTFENRTGASQFKELTDSNFQRLFANLLFYYSFPSQVMFESCIDRYV